MLFSRKTRPAVLGTIGITTVLFTGAIAFAQTSISQSANRSGNLPTVSNLLPTENSQNSNANNTPAETSNPYGCYGRSDLPHASHHDPGNITAQVVTKCSVSMPNITAYGDLERALGLGFTSTVDTAYKSKNNSSYVHANPGAPFPVSYNSLYLIYGTSTATDAAGNLYIGYTSNQAWVSP